MVVLVSKSRTNTSGCALVSVPIRLVASEPKATIRPSPEILGTKLLPPMASAFAVERLTRWVVRFTRSRTKTSIRPLVSPATKLVAPETNATNRPSAEIVPLELVSLPSMPVFDTLTRSIAPVWRSCTNTSDCTLISPLTKFSLELLNTTNLPSGEIT